jgi:sn-glycerol 3-phosphate transport system permease protein
MRGLQRAAPGLSLAGKIIIGLLLISPVILGLSFSFMSPSERAEIPPHIVPREPVTGNYATAVRSVPVFRFILNSLLVCSLVILGQVFTCSFGAYAFSFFTFPGRRFLFLVVLSTMMIPADAIIIANYLTISRLRLNDTYTAMVAPYLSSAMGIFLMRQFFLTIPRELREAALMDGCRDLRFLFSVALPISKPAIASLGVYIFIQVYNQFLWPLLVTNTNRMRTVQVGISILKEAEITDYGVVLAGSVLILIPAVFVFIIGQKYLVKGMTAGAVKG